MRGELSMRASIASVRRAPHPPRRARRGSSPPTQTATTLRPMHRAEITDLYRLDELLSPEEKAARDLVAQFVDREYLPLVGKHFRDGTFPLELVPRLAE